MRVFCPNCSEAITISDDLAGQATFCPLCKSAFTAPTLFPVPPAAPPVPVPAASPPQTTSISSEPPGKDASMSVPTTIPFPTAPASPGTPPGYSHSVGFALLPEIVQWTAPAALVLSVILTFFPWSGIYPGGHGVYTQSAWGSLFGSYSTDAVGDKVLKFDVKDEKGKSLRDEVHTNWLMLPYLPGLLLTTVLAVLFAILPALKWKLPAQIQPYLPWRMGLIAVLSLLLTGALCLQSIRGFGLQNAIQARIDLQLQKQKEEAKTPEEIKTYEIRRGLAPDGIEAEQTTANRLAILLHFVAIIGAAGTVLMVRRGDKPPPRIEVMW